MQSSAEHRQRSASRPYAGGAASPQSHVVPGVLALILCLPLSGFLITLPSPRPLPVPDRSNSNVLARLSVSCHAECSTLPHRDYPPAVIDSPSTLDTPVETRPFSCVGSLPEPLSPPSPHLRVLNAQGEPVRSWRPINNGTDARRRASECGCVRRDPRGSDL